MKNQISFSKVVGTFYILGLLCLQSAFAEDNQEVLLRKKSVAGFLPAPSIYNYECEIFANKVTLRRFVATLSTEETRNQILTSSLASLRDTVERAVSAKKTHSEGPTDGRVTTYEAIQADSTGNLVTHTLFRSGQNQVETEGSAAQTLRRFLDISCGSNP